MRNRLVRMTQPAKLDTASPASDARDQAEAYDSIFANTPLELCDGTILEIPPHPDFGMLDDDRIDDYNELLFERDTTYDREQDIFIPEQRMKDPNTGEENGVVLPATTERGMLKVPYRVDGKLLKPAWSVRVVKACLGEKDYELLRAGGKSSADVWRIWGKQGQLARERQAADSKSHGSAVDLEAVSSSNSE